MKSPSEDIVYGRAHIMWAPPIQRLNLEEGWVLPGGVRTKNRMVAQLIAIKMDRIMSAQK